MKNIYYLVFAITIFSLAGCKEDNPTEPPAPKEPTVSIIFPTNNSSVYGSTYIEVEVTHDVKIAKVDIFIDGISDPGNTFEFEAGKHRYVWSIPKSDNGKKHNLYATAEDEGGNKGRSETIEVVVYHFAAPTELGMTHISPNEIQLNWIDNTEHEDGYIIERKITGDFVEIIRVSSDIKSYIDNTLTINNNYTYKVRGYKDTFFTNYSNEIKLTYRQEIEIAKVLEGHSGFVATCDYSPDGSMLATGGSDLFINLWNSSEGTLINKLPGHEEHIKTITFTPDGDRIISAGSGTSIKIWNSANGELFESIRRQPHTKDINGISVSPDGSKFVTAGSDELIVLWDLVTGDTIKTISFFIDDFSTIPRRMADVKYSPDNNYIAIIHTGHQLSRTGSIYIFNPESEILSYPQMISFSPYPDITSMFSICYSPDGNYILTAAENGRVYVWDTNLNTDARAFEFTTHHQNSLFSADFSPDGNWIIAGGSNGYIYLAKCSGIKVASVMETESGAVYSVKYSPDGTQAASCHENGNVILWDVSMRWTLVE